MFDQLLPEVLNWDHVQAWTRDVADSERKLIGTYISEAEFFERVLDPEISRLADGSRVLESGSGIGLLSRLIASRGHSVVSFEPGAGGFSSMASLSKVVDSCWKGVPPVVEAIPEASDLGRVSGSFDLVIAIT